MKWYLKVLKQYADFNGRARRKEYWMFTLFHVIFTYALIFLGIALMEATNSMVFVFLYFIYILALLIPALAVSVRRMHDVGKSGWYILIPIYSLILAVTEGDKGANEYGADPKGLNAEEIEEIGKPQIDG
jgi:uncharacterized membrane protein YhaH (DUF805 family)